MANKKPKKSIVEIGGQVPRSLKFGIIVAVALLWAQFLRSGLTEFFVGVFEVDSAVRVDFSVAVFGTVIGYILLVAYRKTMNGIKKVKV